MATPKNTHTENIDNPKFQVATKNLHENGFLFAMNFGKKYNIAKYSITEAIGSCGVK